MGQLQLWIGLVDLRPFDRRSYGSAGAFTNIITWASDQESFRSKVENLASSLEMFVIAVEWAEAVAERAKKWNTTEEIDDMIQRAEVNPEAIIYGTFHQYLNDEA